MRNRKIIVLALIVGLVIMTLIINFNKSDIGKSNEIVDEIQITNDIQETLENTIPEENIIVENVVVLEGNENIQEAETIKPKQESQNNKETQEHNKATTPKQTEKPKVNDKKTIQETPKSTTPKEESKPVVKNEPKEEQPSAPKCTDKDHAVSVGNSNRWFNSKQEAIAYYDKIIKDLGEKWTSGKIKDYETYSKNCPDGYEIWDCPYCNKWTINLYY